MPTKVGQALNTLRIIFCFIFILFIDSANHLQHINADGEQEHQHDYGYEANMKAKKFILNRLILERTSKLVITMLKREEELEEVKREHDVSTKGQERLETIMSFKNKIIALKVEVEELRKQEKNIDHLKRQIEQQTEEHYQLMNRHEISKQKQTSL
ncbi:hypothetical protein CU098_010471 [Rhizopus stolonifer]|uniref:Uncharacterized protein n=1 Tax=Rhizopus stolonifer TaxID=4846 RepID=A0A367JY37_RHIST|nr:hypothetical protein CU098_010471 [Rhizopus stolonifer]